MENNFDFKKYGFVFVLLLIVFCFWRYVSNPLVVTVSGTGKVTVPATSARVNASVVVTSDTVEKATEDLKTKVAAVRLAMVTGGVNEKNVTQSQVEVSPLSAVVSGAKGYSATASLLGKIDDVTRASDLVVKLYMAGASVVSQPVIEVSNSSELENSALKNALNEANINAKYVANLRRKFFRKMRSIEQASSGNSTVTTKIETSAEGEVVNSFEVVKAVSVVYWMW